MGNPTKKQIEELVSSIQESSLDDQNKHNFLEKAEQIETEAHYKEVKGRFASAVKKQTAESTQTSTGKTTSTSNTTDSIAVTTQEEIDPLKDFGRFLHSSKDAQEFYTIAVLTGDLSSTEEPSELEKRQFLADFEAWVKGGKPRPSMPKIPKGEVKIPTAAYRIRDRKSDKIYVYYNDGSVLGKKEEFFKKKATDPETNETIETDEIDDTKKPVMTFDLEFSPKKAKGIIDEADKLVPPGRNFALYFFHKGAKQTISEKNFVKPYREVAEMLERKQSID